MTTKKPSSKASSPDINLPFLEPLEPLAPLSPLTFPRFEDLVAEDLKKQTTQTRKETDLFSGYLGDPAVLLEDFQLHPEKYGVETHELMGQLMQGSKSVEHLNPSDRRLLNLATVDYYQAAPAKPAEKKRQFTKSAGAQQRPSRIRKPRPQRTARAELPDFWWLA